MNTILFYALFGCVGTAFCSDQSVSSQHLKNWPNEQSYSSGYYRLLVVRSQIAQKNKSSEEAVFIQRKTVDDQAHKKVESFLQECYRIEKAAKKDL